MTALLTPALCECFSLVAQIPISVLFLDSACNCTVLVFDSILVHTISELFSSICFFSAYFPEVFESFSLCGT